METTTTSAHELEAGQSVGRLFGVLTHLDLPEAEEEFPGINAFFEGCSAKPTTFLELCFAFEAALAHAG